MLKAIEASNDPLRHRDMALFVLYAYTGLRRNEALSLKIQDVDLAKRVITVYQQKTGASDIRILPTSLAVILEAYLIRRSDNEVGSRSSWLFCGRDASRALAARQAQDRFHHWRVKSLHHGQGSTQDTLLRQASLQRFDIVRST